jgi:glycosyltransferase involved in cell wall biosynthesis
MSELGLPAPPSTDVILIAAAGWHDESPGGANKLPTDFARYLVRRGHRVGYLCASNSVDQITEGSVDGVDLMRYPSPTARSPSFANVRQHWTATRSIVRSVMARAQIGTLLGHGPLQYLAAATICPPEIRRCYGAHSPLPDELAQGRAARPTLKERTAWALAWLIERRLLNVSDIVHCDSEYSRRLMQSRYPRALNGKAVVLPGWVDAAHFDARSVSRDALRARLGLPWRQGVPTFFTLRRLVPRMGLDALIEATALLVMRGHPCRLVIGGEGPERNRLESLAAERGIANLVAFLGRISERNLSDHYAAADCFVLPTRTLECFGLIVLESYAAGVPVIGVPVGSIPEVMGSEFSAWIADDNQVAALARRMDDFLEGRLIVDPARLRHRAQEFDMQRIAEQHERALLPEGMVHVRS